MLKPGDILDGKYEVKKVLGQGGMGVVYLCINKRLENYWAIKEVKGKLKDRVDFLAEPNILKKLNHSGIPRIVDIFNEGDNLYIVEDYIEGETLEKMILREGKLSGEKIIEIAVKLCDIIGYLHSFNPPIIYRDLKPSNIMISSGGKVNLVDFGISRVYKEEQSGDTMLMGSRGYAAPEQYGGEQSSRQTDIYGLGATIYFMAAGEAPPMVIDLSHDKNYGKGIDEKLGKIIERAMKINSAHRYSSIDEVKKHLNILNEEKNKTLFMGRSGNEETKTRLMGDKTAVVTGRKSGKGGLIKILAGFGILVLILSSLLYLVLNSGKGDKAGTDNTKPPLSQSKPQQNPEAQKQVVEDKNIEGVIYRNSPVTTKYSDEGAPKGKGKGKSREIYSLLYKLSPQAQNGRYDNKLTLSVDYMEFTRDGAVAYCTIESSSLKGLVISKNDTYLISNDGKSSRATLIYTGETSSSGNTVKQNIKISFDYLDINTDKIALKSKISLKDMADSTKDINLIVNVK